MINEEKQKLRKKIGAKRATLDFQWLEKSSAAIITHFQSLEVFQSSETVALYMAIGGEVQLDPLFSDCWKLGKRICIPVYNSTLKIYEMVEITANTEFKTGNYGIKEPISPALVPIENIDLIAVPGVAFDLVGNRLGRGGGYYDRMLENFSGFAAAVAFDFQIFDRIPVDPHDKPVNTLITETKVVEV